jgi:hypothetical protein
MNKNLTSNTELLDILKNNNIKINGVFAKDKLKKPLQDSKNPRRASLKDGFYIVNLDNSDGPGTHWTVLYKINDGFSFWWDSFGFPAPEEIEDLLHKYEYNKKQIQDIKSTSCGFYCIAFIKFMINKQDKMKAFNTFCNLFRANTIDNEIILHQLLY